MSGGFNIPGLGQAKPNETLPASSFAPDILAAAASIGGEADGELPVTEKDSQIEVEQQISAGVNGEAANTTAAEGSHDATTQQNANGDGMEVDGLPDKPSETTATVTTQEDIHMQEKPPGSPSVTHALEAALDGLLGTAAEENTEAHAEAPREIQGGSGDANPEWEADSSPYVSESESDSSDDSSSDDDSSEDESKLMGIEETVRMLMEADAGSDDEADGAKIAKQAAGVRTKNELPDEPDERPNIVITADDEVLPLGMVKHIVEGTQVLVEALTGIAAPTILDRGSVLCKEDRTVLGVIHDTIATVHRPMYLMSFRSEEAIQEAGVQTGLQIWYPKGHAKYVFPAQLRQEKGSDASNLHDEEVGPDEMEYSDDEAEQAHKREKKGRKRGKHGRNKEETESIRKNGFADNASADQSLNYDEDEDGPYKPLARPASFGRGQGTAAGNYSGPSAGHSRGGGSFRGHRDSRGRGGRGRGFGGRGRGGNQNHGHSNNAQDGYALPPQSYMAPAPYNAASPPLYPPVPPPPPQYAGGQAGAPPPPFPPLPGGFNFQIPGWNQGHAQQPHYPPNMPPVPFPPFIPPQASGAYGAPAPGAQGQQAQASPPAGYYGSPAYGSQPQNGQQRWG